MTDSAAMRSPLSPEKKAALKLLGISDLEWWFTNGRYLNARKELTNLRVGVARIAQAVDIKGVHGDSETPFEDLAARAEHLERGWNGLCADIIARIKGEI